MATELIVSVGDKHTIREYLRNDFRLCADSSYKISAEKEMGSNNKRLDRLSKHLKHEFFLEQVQKKTTTGRIGPDSQTRQTVDNEEVI